MKIYISSDHRGFELKSQLLSWLQVKGLDVIDCGNDHLEPLDDYVDFTFKTARSLQEDLQENPSSDSLAIGVCGSGIGVAIAANRLKGIRCALSHDADHVRHGRENDHTNMLSLAADTLTVEEAQNIIETFISAQPKQDEKYVRRAKKLDS